MRILVVQLTRIGDIYSTWPSLRALHRNYPDAQIDILVRPRFAGACQGLDFLHQVIELPMQEIFRELLSDAVSDKECLQNGMQAMDSFLSWMQQRNYDQIINLSFSPSSSFLVKCIEGPNTEVRGYSRHPDGFLRMDDDASAYFYAQAGVRNFNRFHVNDLFAEVCGVALTEEDYRVPVAHELPSILGLYVGSSPYVVVHLAASTQHKSLPIEKWINLARRFIQQRAERLVLIGAPLDQVLAEQLIQVLGSDRIINLVGKTSLLDLFPLLRDARLLVGVDSGPIHIAALVQTPVYNLSNAKVRFWETGPKAAGSQVRICESFDQLGSDQIMKDIGHLLNGEVPSDELAVIHSPLGEYQVEATDPSAEFAWKLIRAIYLGEDFPVPPNLAVVEGLQQLQELNAMSLQQFHAILRKEQHEENQRILENIDELVENIIMMIPEIGPLVQWYQTEKLRVGPIGKEAIIGKYTEIHETLARILSIYTGEKWQEHSQQQESNNENRI